MSSLAGQEGVTPKAPTKVAQRVMRLVLEGEIGQEAVADVSAMIERLPASGVLQVVIDCSEVSHFDYRGVRPLLRRVEALREQGGDVRLAGLSPYVFAIFRSAGADGAFDYFASVDDAVASFTRGIAAFGG